MSNITIYVPNNTTDEQITEINSLIEHEQLYNCDFSVNNHIIVKEHNQQFFSSIDTDDDDDYNYELIILKSSIDDILQPEYY